MKNLQDILKQPLNLSSKEAAFSGARMSKEIPNLYMNEKGFFEHCVPEKYANANLETCDKQPQSFIEYARQWAMKPESVVLLGPVGRGKTQFAFAMIREMFRKCPKHIWPRYFTSTNLDSTLLEAVKSDEGDKEKIKDIGTQDLLFIDDFGRETRSERIGRQYFEIINLRYSKNLPTIISTNLTLEDIGRLINDAIASRFQEWQLIEFCGEDLRIFKKL